VTVTSVEKSNFIQEETSVPVRCKADSYQPGQVASKNTFSAPCIVFLHEFSPLTIMLRSQRNTLRDAGNGNNLRGACMRRDLRTPLPTVFTSVRKFATLWAIFVFVILHTLAPKETQAAMSHFDFVAEMPFQNPPSAYR
jgi:hypothetical protein